MSPKFHIAYFAHSIRSDWNNGNAHFLRGLLRSLGECGHSVEVFEPHNGWSINNLLTEPNPERTLQQFRSTYPDLSVSSYLLDPNGGEAPFVPLRELVRDADVVIVHEWNEPRLARRLLELRDELGFRILFHDTHHRASSSPEQIRLFGIDQFDGVLAFGESLRKLYRDRFNIHKTWTLHEAADVSVFYPISSRPKQHDVVWIGNWGDDERSAEIHEFLLNPAMNLTQFSFMVFGVRYPVEALAALQASGARYGGYLPNLDGPLTYASSRLTVHIPRQQYASTMRGIPTIRVFEALASGIPLICAPWEDSEHLFRDGDFCMARNATEMKRAMETLLCDEKLAKEQACRGLMTVRSRHTCRHRAEELSSICEELLR